MTTQKKIELLQVLRGAGAIAVLWSHYFSNKSITNLSSSGQMGVAFFFLINGFVLVYSTQAKGIEHYWSKKALRLLPLYYLTTIIVFILGMIAPNLLHSSQVTVPALIKSALFIPYLTEAGVYPLYPICWTLTVEVFVYLVYYLAYLNFDKYAGIATAIVLIVFVILGQFVLTNTLFAQVYGRIYMLNFSIGMLSASFLPKIQHSIKVPVPITLIGYIIFLWISLYFKETLLWTIGVGIVFVILISIGQSLSFTPCFVKFGDATYSFYLIHYFIAKGWLRIVTPKIGNSFILEITGFILCLVITTILAQISYRKIESLVYTRFFGF